jgi:hypothetical protein
LLHTEGELRLANLEAKEFRILLLESIDDVIRGVLGDRPLEAMFSCLEKSFNVRHEEIPDRLDDFQTALGKICGTGAPVLTRMIARNLCNKIGGCSYHERSDWNLKMYVENCRRRYEEES